MKVLLLDNVKDIGKKGAVVTVADGLARNKLIPLKKALEATPGNLAKYQNLTNTGQSTSNEVPPKVYETLAESPLAIPARADSHGSLYKAIHEREIVSAIHARIPAHLRSSIHQEHIHIPVIKKTGKYTIQVGTHDCTLEVVSEK